MTVRTTQNEYQFFNGENADGVSTPFRVGGWRNVTVTIATANSANLTLKCQGNGTWDAPNFGAARTIANTWDYIGLYDYNNARIVVGDDGIAFAGADDVRVFSVNIDGIEWLSFEISNYVAGNVYVTARFYTNA